MYQVTGRQDKSGEFFSSNILEELRKLKKEIMQR